MKRRRIQLSVMIAFVLVLCYSVSRTNLPSLIGRSPPAHLANGTHVILAWTPIFGDWSFWYPPGHGRRPFANALCRRDDCYLTTDRAYVDSAAAVLFHCRDRFASWPRVRPPDQLYGVVCHESPSNSDFGPYGDRINVTLTYRRDSDVYFPQCWFEPLAERSGARTYRLRNPLAARRYSVVWPVSNCRTASKRELYAERLQRHADVHVYGACGAYRCPKSRSDHCMRQFARSYKFYLAFENSLCVDYVSEKFFAPLQYELIPIVLGGADYALYPERSYINVNDFRSPEQLAEYLSYLAANETAYSEYFQWRLQYRISCLNKEKLYCDLCKMLHDGYRHRYADVATWWSKDACDNEKTIKLM